MVNKVYHTQQYSSSLRHISRHCTLQSLANPQDIATSIVHSKLDHCNSLYYNLPKSQTNRLQVIQNSLNPQRFFIFSFF